MRSPARCAGALISTRRTSRISTARFASRPPICSMRTASSVCWKKHNPTRSTTSRRSLCLPTAGATRSTRARSLPWVLSASSKRCGEWRHRHTCYQATSREIFGGIGGDGVAANESTPIYANNPYGIAKAYADMMVDCYRESYGLFVCGGILFNHESPRRSLHFVTRKITAGVACIKNGSRNVPLNEIGEPLIGSDGKLHVGDLSTTRDWGYAKEYAEAMWLMLQHETPRDYVIATNTTRSVADLLRIAFAHVGLDWQEHTVEDKKFFRPTEIKELTGDYSLAKRELGWEPQTTFEELIAMMVDADLQRFRSEM